MKFKKSICIFRRDLRLEDNTALIEALKSSETVIPCFIFNPLQIENNEYLSKKSLNFMIESLRDLEIQLKEKKAKLYLFYGLPEEIIDKLLEQEDIEAIFVNKDYTPFSIKRDSKIKEICEKSLVEFISYEDYTINEIEAIKTDRRKPYTIFTPYYKKAAIRGVKFPLENKYENFYTKSIEIENKEIINSIKTEESQIKGGRKKALEILDKLEEQKNYASERDYPSLERTTHLSAHLKFGNISIREMYYAIKQKLGEEHPLIRQLYWREFYYQIIFHFPKVLGKSFKEEYNDLKWKNDKQLIEAWKNGQTGFPIIDAGMRQLNLTGFMHNRVRMIVASFLVKDLNVDWRIGEKYFAQKLIDYDPGLNNGNWQWAASTGCDSQPYFRIFNPWLQQKKFDKETEYIKKFIPELKDFNPNEINNEKRTSTLGKYPAPIINHNINSKMSIEMFKSIR